LQNLCHHPTARRRKRHASIVDRRDEDDEDYPIGAFSYRDSGILVQDASPWQSYPHFYGLSYVPVGFSYHAVDWTGAIIPELVSGATVAATLGVSGEIDRRDVLSDETIVPEPTIAPQESQLMDEPFDWARYPLGGQAWVDWKAGQHIVDPGLGNISEDNMGWYTDLDEFLGGILPGGAPNTTQFPTWGDPGSGFIDPGTFLPPVTTQPVIPPAASLPAMAVAPGGACPTDDPMKGCVYKKVCGQWRWVKQKQRRRKALVTKSDAQGLAVLKGLVGVGKTMDTWIATHS